MWRPDAKGLEGQQCEARPGGASLPRCSPNLLKGKKNSLRTTNKGRTQRKSPLECADQSPAAYCFLAQPPNPEACNLPTKAPPNCSLLDLPSTYNATLSGVLLFQCARLSPAAYCFLDGIKKSLKWKKIATHDHKTVRSESPHKSLLAHATPRPATHCPPLRGPITSLIR
jgi:hypothetical protein